MNALALRKEGSGRAGDWNEESTNAIPQEAERMDSVVNIRMNWGKWRRGNRKRNKSRGPTRSPDWYAERYEDQQPKRGKCGDGFTVKATNLFAFRGSEAGVLQEVIPRTSHLLRNTHPILAQGCMQGQP